MKFVKIRTHKSPEELLAMLSDNDKVNERVRFDTKRGTPHMKLKETKRGIRMTCELLGGTTRDNGFLVGTYFSGRIREKNGVTTLTGRILTAPIYHAILLIFIALFVIQCFVVKGFSVIPVFAVLLDVLLFKEEFKKQGYIYRYLYRAAKRLEMN